MTEHDNFRTDPPDGVCTGAAANVTMKTLPPGERPYEKCMKHGPGVLSDAELLAVILRTGSYGQTALQMAGEILDLCPFRKDLAGMLHLTLQDLCGINGVGRVKAVQILCIGELSRRIARLEAERGLRFEDPASVAAYYMEDLRHCEQETVRCMMLDTRSRLIGECEIHRGTVNNSFMSAREVFLGALSFHAVSIILIHNHPSGDATPSEEDILVTQRLMTAGELIGIRLLDHIIIGDHTYVSLIQEGRLEGALSD